MVAVEDDEGVFGEFEFIELGQQATDVLIHGEGLAEEAPHGVIHIATVFSHRGELLALVVGEVVVLHLQVGELIHKALLRLDGMMGDVAPHVHVEGHVLVLLQKGDGVVIEAGVLAAIGGLRGCVFFVGADHVDAIRSRRQARSDVPFAKVAGGVTCFFHQLSDCDAIPKTKAGGILGEGRWPFARHEACACGAASDTGGVELSEAGALAREAVDVGRPRVWMAVAGGITPAVVVGEDEDDVGL